ncbi:MAG: plasmid stabilization system protein ParE [Gammaproteobacteria bacterium]
MKKIRLADTAKGRLLEIANFSVKSFGDVQAKQYKTQLIARLNHIASGKPAHGKICGILVGVEPSSKLLYYREGKHYIVYEENETVVGVADFVHVSRNLPEVIAKLEESTLK